MFASSLGLLLGYLFAYILLPFVPGAIAMHLMSGKHLRGAMFYLLSWFVGVGVVGYGMFLMQFVRFGIDWIAYIALVLILLIALAVRVRMSGWKWKELCSSWKMHFPGEELARDWKERTDLSKGAVIVVSALVLIFLVATFIFVTNMPSYADDAFGNRHMPVINIVYDGGIKIFGQAGEILARGRLGYPVMIPAFQAFIASIMGGYNDIYINLFPWLAVVFFLGASKTFIFAHTKDILKTIIGPALIISLPLIFMHTTQGYMDMLSAIYTALAVMSLYEWISDHGSKYDLLLGVAFLSILSYVKNDGFIVYMVGTIIALALYFIIFRASAEKLKVLKKPSVRIPIIVLILFFIAPFTFIKSYYHLGFNQAAGADAGLGLASTIHWEIFPALWKTMRSMNNFSLAPALFFFVILFMLVQRKKVTPQKWFLLLAPVVIMAIFLAVFLFTENYKFVLDQTTSNRVFTMVFVIFFSYAVLLRDVTSD